MPRAEFNEKNEVLKTAADTIKERDKQLVALGKSAKGNEELSAKIIKLTAKYIFAQTHRQILWRR